MLELKWSSLPYRVANLLSITVSSELIADGLRALVDQSGEGACLVDPGDWRVVYVNAALAGLAGGDPESAGAPLSAYLTDVDEPRVQAELARLASGERNEATFFSRIGSGGTAAGIHARRVARGDRVLVALTVKAGSGMLPRIQTPGRQGVDPLTGLADRAALLATLTDVLSGRRSGDRSHCVLFIDVDDFKRVNDAHGHLVGDRVLGEVARRLAECVRVGDLVARFGGDEFVVLLEDCGDGDGDGDDIESVTRRIAVAFEQPIPLPQGAVTLGVSIGAARAGAGGRTAEALIDAADRAMYAAKRAAV